MQISNRTIRNTITSSAEECCGAITHQLNPWILQNSESDS